MLSRIFVKIIDRTEKSIKCLKKLKSQHLTLTKQESNLENKTTPSTVRPAIKKIKMTKLVECLFCSFKHHSKLKMQRHFLLKHRGYLIFVWTYGKRLCIDHLFIYLFLAKQLKKKMSSINTKNDYISLNKEQNMSSSSQYEDINSTVEAGDQNVDKSPISPSPCLESTHSPTNSSLMEIQSLPTTSDDINETNSVPYNLNVNLNSSFMNDEDEDSNFSPNHRQIIQNWIKSTAPNRNIINRFQKQNESKCKVQINPLIFTKPVSALKPPVSHAQPNKRSKNASLENKSNKVHINPMIFDGNTLDYQKLWHYNRPLGGLQRKVNQLISVRNNTYCSTSLDKLPPAYSLRSEKSRNASDSKGFDSQCEIKLEKH